ncbi:MAG: hypothetical protein ACREN2_10175 [Candidatus Dormibacteria bacterium]
MTELLVSTAVLGLVMASLAGAIGIGLRVIGPGGAQAQLVGSNDVLALEQQVGKDVNRAVCLAAKPPPDPPPPPTYIPPPPIPTGGCTNSVQKTGGAGSTCGPGYYLLCIAWYWYPAGSPPVCHTITYRQGAGSAYVIRTDYNDGTGATTTSHISTGDYAAFATWTSAPTSTTASGATATYQWTYQVNLAFQQVQTVLRPGSTAVTASFSMAPLSMDPLSPSLTAAAGWPSC